MPAPAPSPALRGLPHIGTLPAGPRNAITDVGRITVGHATVAAHAVQTGVTVIRPHDGDLFRQRVPAGLAIINGFGKSVGLMQVQELGQIEAPIALTNTFSVSAVAQAQIAQCVAHNPETGRSLPTLNPLVLECNDGYLNDIQRMAITPAHYHAALHAAGPHCAQGAVGAGRGMSAFRFKGGIGTASRQVNLPGTPARTVGALVLANYGLLPQLVWNGQHLGPALEHWLQQHNTHRPPPAQPASVDEAPGPEKGSIIMVLATDAPLDSRQLTRLARRAAAGLARTGSVYGHGSGDIALAISTAYTLPLEATHPMPAIAMLHETWLDPLFQAAADSVEQSILHALWHAEAVTGRDGHHRPALHTALTALAGHATVRTATP